MAVEKEIVDSGVCGVWTWEVEKVEKKTPNQYGTHFFTFSVFQVKNIGYGNKKYGTNCPSWEGDDKVNATIAARDSAVALEKAHAAEHKAANSEEEAAEENPYTA